MRKGDVVTLLMENRPEYIMAWLGLIKNGCIAALVNTHLTGQPLGHSINARRRQASDPRRRAGRDLCHRAVGLEAQPRLWVTGGARAGLRRSGRRARRAIGCADAARETRDDLYCRDKALYIYTSGTTGLPKAANISHMRLLHIMSAFQGAVNGEPDDRMYDVLPLYHSSGGIAALGPPFLGGGSLVVRSGSPPPNSGTIATAISRPCSNISASFAAIC